MITDANVKTSAWLRTTRSGVRISPGALLKQALTATRKTQSPNETQFFQ